MSKKYNSKPVDTKHVVETSRTTGEVVEYEKNVYAELSVQKQKEYSCREDEFNELRGEYLGEYYSLFFRKFKDIDIPPQVKVRFLYLSSFINYDGYIVNNEKETHQERLNRGDLRSILLLGKSEFNETLSILKQYNLLVEDENGFKANKEYTIKGALTGIKNKSGNYIRIFENGMKKIYKQSLPRQHKQLYYFFALLPYVNLKFNVVVSNDTRIEDPSKIIAMSMKDICGIVKYDRSKSARLEKELLQFKIDDKCVLGIFKRGRTQSVEVNPAIYYGGTVNQVEALKMLMAKFEYTMSK